MKILLMLALLLGGAPFSSEHLSDVVEAESCQSGGSDYCSLFGAVFVEETEGFADYKVFVEDVESFSDLVVFKEQARSFADRTGLWYFTDVRAFADFTVSYTDVKGFAHFSVYFSDFKSLAGCQN